MVDTKKMKYGYTIVAQERVRPDHFVAAFLTICLLQKNVNLNWVGEVVVFPICNMKYLNKALGNTNYYDLDTRNRAGVRVAIIKLNLYAIFLHLYSLFFSASQK